MRERKRMPMRVLCSIGILIAFAAGGSAFAQDESVLEFGGVSGTLRTSNTQHFSVELTNTGDRTITAHRGTVEVLNDFGEVAGTIPVEMTSRSTRIRYTDDEEKERVPFRIEPGETIHYFLIVFTDYSSGPTRYVVTKDGFERAVDNEFIVPVDQADGPAKTRFVLEDVVIEELGEND